MFYFPIALSLIAEQLQIFFPPLIAEVRSQADYFSEYPQQIRANTKQSAVLYSRQPGYYALHYKQPGTDVSGAVLQLNEGTIAVFQGEPNQPENAVQIAANTAVLSPVYTLQPSGSLAVPTGQVFIRFADKVNIESRQEAIRQAGYEVAQSLSYAPQAAWLQARSGNILDALVGIPKLEAIADIENVEPQMLMARSWR